MNPVTRYLRPFCVSATMILTMTGLVKSTFSMNISSSPSTLPPPSNTSSSSGTSSSSDNNPSAINYSSAMNDVATLDLEEGEMMASEDSAKIDSDQAMTTLANEEAQSAQEAASQMAQSAAASIATSAAIMSANGAGAHEFTPKI